MLNEAVRSNQHARAQARHEVKSSNRAIIADLRRQLECGVLQLTGVQTKPTRNTQPTVITGVWASDMSFDFESSTVTIDDQRFVLVRVEGTDEQAERRPMLHAVQPNSVQPNDTGAGTAGSPRRGRENLTPFVEEALHACWHLVADWEGQRSKRRKTVSDVAGHLEKWLNKEYGATHNGLPSCETIRKKLPSVYQQLLGDKAAR